MRRVLPVLLVLASCRCPGPDGGSDEGVVSVAPGRVELLQTHRGATSLWRDGELWVSTTADWGRAAPIRFSRGSAPVHHTRNGWVAGVHEGRVLVLSVLSESELAVESVSGDGKATHLGTVPRPPSPYRYASTVSGRGEVVVAGEAKGVEPRMIVVGPGGARDVPGVVQSGDAVWSIAADPGSSRVAVMLSQVRGTPDIDRGARLLVVDTLTGAVERRQLDGSLSAAEGELAFDADGELWLHVDDAFVELAQGGETRHLVGMTFNARNLVVAPDASAVAWTQKHGDGHMIPLSSSKSCTVHFVGMAETERYVEPVRRFDGSCYFGLGLAFHEGTLWVAPP